MELPSRPRPFHLAPFGTEPLDRKRLSFVTYIELDDDLHT